MRNPTRIRGMIVFMGKPFIDLSGQKFGRLTFLSRDTRQGRSVTKWYCRCDCGKVISSQPACIKNGLVVSCGCYQREAILRAVTKHGAASDGNRTPEYVAWSHMKDRCLNKKSRGYAAYGGRGITICKQWELSFETFLLDMGKRPSRKHSIDRTDNDGPYSPSNCRWATQKQQQRNKRITVKYRFNGDNLTAGEYAEKYCLNESKLRDRLNRGWPIERALTEKLDAIIMK